MWGSQNKLCRGILLARYKSHIHRVGVCKWIDAKLMCKQFLVWIEHILIDRGYMSVGESTLDIVSTSWVDDTWKREFGLNIYNGRFHLDIKFNANLRYLLWLVVLYGINYWGPISVCVCVCWFPLNCNLMCISYR